jgi:hypothetical protein
VKRETVRLMDDDSTVGALKALLADIPDSYTVVIEQTYDCGFGPCTQITIDDNAHEVIL